MPHGVSRSQENFYDLLCRERVTILSQTPAAFEQLSRTDQMEQRPLALRRVIFGGEALSFAKLRPWAVRHGLEAAQLINMYGITETTVHVTARRIVLSDLDINGGSVIGRALADLQAYVLDEWLEPVPIGVSGELYIGGAGLARGYLKRAGLTAQRFIANPFGEGERLYCTGDLVRYRADGNLEFIGRRDAQVKVRGYRIELGEVESALLGHAGVSQAVVVARQEEAGEKRLVGYVVGEASLDVVQLRAHLKHQLPAYMVPAALVQLERMPLSANGKIDRKALPAPEGRPDIAPYEEPRDEVERTLARIWREVLRLDRVGIHDNFFELGGDSIQSIRIVGRAAQAGVTLTVRQMFEHQTIAQLVGVASTVSEVVAEQSAVVGRFALTPIQRWYLQEESAQAHHFNQAMLLRFTRRITRGVLEGALGQLLEHHDALRLRYVREASGWWQQSAAWDGSVPLEEIDLRGEGDQAQGLSREADRLQGSLDLAHGPLLRAGLFELSGGEQRLLLVIHHLVVDGVSWRILLEDLCHAYEQLEGGGTVYLGAKSSSFKSWSEQLQVYADSAQLREELPYWQSLRTVQTVSLPLDHEQGRNSVASGRTVSVGLSEEQTSALLQEVPQVYHTQINDVLLTALALALEQWAGAGRQLIALEGHGREELFAQVDVSRTVGWFTSIFPVVLDTGGEGDVGAVLKRIKEQLRGIPRRGIGYGMLRYMGAAPELMQDREPGLSFNYLGQFAEGAGATGWLRRAEEGTGLSRSLEGMRKQLIEVNASVSAGQLRLHWSYSNALHERARIEALAQGYIEKLQQLIAHCQRSAGGYTPSDFPLARQSQEQLDQIILASGGAQRVADMYPASMLQQGLLFHSLYAPQSTLYVVSVGWQLSGALDAAALQRAWQRVVERHEVFRTGFVGQELETLLQVVWRAVQLPFEHLDWRGLAEQEQQRRWEELREADRARGFEFSTPPLMRLTLVRLRDEEHRLLWSHHHALLDGWSVPIVLNEVFACYLAFSGGEEVQLAAARPYREYIAWLQGQDLDKAQRYWRERLAGLSGATQLQIDRGTKKDEGAGQYAQRRQVFSIELSRLEAFARQQQLTLNTLVLGAWALVLSRYSGSADVVFGVTVAGRPAELTQVEQRVGLYINTLPLRAQLSAEDSVLSLLRQVQSRQSELIEYQYTPLTQVQRCSGLAPGTALFETTYVFENYPVQMSEAAAMRRAIQISEVSTVERPHYLLTLQVAAHGELSASAIYDAARLPGASVERLLNHLGTALSEMLADPLRSCAQISLLSEAERDQLLVQWNRTEREYPQDRCIHELFAEQAARTPQGIALQYEEQSLSYAELEARANQLAHYLRSLGVGPDVIVGLCVERSIEMVVGLLGILKAGGAYLPLDPEYPPERLAFMLEDAQASVLLTQSALRDRASAHTVVFLDQEWERIAEHALSAPITRVLPHNLAYVIYTSGSTCVPKGVMVAHEAIVNRLVSAG